MIILPRQAACRSCAHYLGVHSVDGSERSEHHRCEAFDQIPREILAGENDHRNPVDGDNGIRYLSVKHTDR